MAFTGPSVTLVQFPLDGGTSEVWLVVQNIVSIEKDSEGKTTVTDISSKKWKFRIPIEEVLKRIG